MNKLKLTFGALDKAQEAKKNPIKVKTGFESPIGWWRVTTEGDVEGRSVTNLGDFYGHVAEIAFHLANKCFYSLQFDPILNRAVGEHQTYEATKTEVWVTLGSDAATWSMSPINRADYMKKWLDAENILTFPSGKGGEVYYAGTYLKLDRVAYENS